MKFRAIDSTGKTVLQAPTFARLEYVATLKGWTYCAERIGGYVGYFIAFNARYFVVAV